jgi:hypothetical protein
MSDVFDEPSVAYEGPYAGKKSWLKNSGTPEAVEARRTINEWYATFPDRSGMVKSRLLGKDELGCLQAIDELYIHHLLPGPEVTYEEDESSPDFRIYRSTEYVTGIEVITHFPESDIAAQILRNSLLVEELNRRVQSDRWYAIVDILEWKSQPSYADVARWLKAEVERLPQPSVSTPEEQRATSVYSSSALSMKFTFIPRGRQFSSPSGIIGFGPGLSWFSATVLRLRRSIGAKGGNRYDYRERPFAILVNVRDPSCGEQDVIDALYGDDAVGFTLDAPESAEPIRRLNGLFSISSGAPEGRNTRISCVFVLKPGWVPGLSSRPQVDRYDNPFAQLPFPDDVLQADRQFRAERNPSGLTMAWTTRPATD